MTVEPIAASLDHGRKSVGEIPDETAIGRLVRATGPTQRKHLRVLVDTNVALDLLQERQPFVLDALQIFALGEAGRVELLLSTDAISTIFYVVSKNADAKSARKAISTLLDFVTLASLDDNAVLHAMTLDFIDIEDALVAAVAEKEQAKVVIIRNVKDFKHSPIRATTPREFLSAWSLGNLGDS